jgi:hypothetical protein
MCAWTGAEGLPDGALHLHYIYLIAVKTLLLRLRNNDMV